MLFWSRRRRESRWDYFTVIENNLSGEVFDPTLTTLFPSAVAWISSDGYAVVTTGTTHDISYTVPADGPRTWNIFCSSGLDYIRTFDMNTDKVVHIDVSLLRAATSMTAHTNASLVMALTDLPVGLTIASFSTDPLLTGDISTLPVGLTAAYFSADFLLTAGSVSSLTVIRDLRLYSIGWNSASVDIVLLSISNAIHANVNHFTYVTPSLRIGDTNAAPGGTPEAATTSPLTTPGSGNSDTDWQWDAGAGKHKALTGMAAIWVMRNNTGHAWTVIATGVA